MPLFQVDIEKKKDEEYWTNRYIVVAADLAAADAIGVQIQTYEAHIHSTAVWFNKRRTSDMVQGTDVFISTPLGGFGQRAIVGGLLPLFNVARVDFGVGQGRPSRKYLRGVISEGDNESGALSAACVAAVNEQYAQPMAALPGYVDVDAQEIVSGACHPMVGMRQLRRGSKRRVTPVLP